MIASVNSAPKDRGKNHFLILILQNKSTRGRPIIEKTPDTKIYTTIFRKNQAQPMRIRIPQKIRMFLNVAFIDKCTSYYKPNPFFWNSLKILRCRRRPYLPILSLDSLYRTAILSATNYITMPLCRIYHIGTRFVNTLMYD